MPEVCCSSRSLAASLETCRRVLGHVRSDSAVDQGMDEAVAAAPYLPGPRELLDVGTDQGAPTEADGHRVQIGLLVAVACRASCGPELRSRLRAWWRRSSSRSASEPAVRGSAAA